MYVFQFVHYLNSLLKLGYLWIYSVLDEISFLNFLETFWDFFTLLQNNFRFLVCLLVCSLPHFLTEIMISSFRWAIFLKFSRDISGIFVHANSKLVHCFGMSVNMFHSWLSWAKPGNLWISYFFWGQLWDLWSGLREISLSLVFHEDSITQI